MIRSMTGYGQERGAISAGIEVTVSVRTVNHRFLEVSSRLPELLWDLEPDVKRIASGAFGRGKVDVSIRMQRASEIATAVTINLEAARLLGKKLREMKDTLGLDGGVSVGDLCRIPGVVETDSPERDLADEATQPFLSLLSSACARVNEMRDAEGRALHVEITRLIEGIERHLGSLESHREELIEEQLSRYRERVGEIATKAGVDIDQDRLAQETVIMVEKGDIVEELARLSSHLDQVRTSLDIEGPVGKKLDFLAQEMLREVNTIGSKSRAAAIRSLVVELKSEVERIREQVQNVE